MADVDFTGAPAFLANGGADFSAWERRFSDLLHDLRLPLPDADFFEQNEVGFSDVVKEKRYGTKSTEQIKRELAVKYRLSEEDLSSLNELSDPDSEEMLWDFVRWIANRASERDRREIDSEMLREDLRSLLRKRQFTEQIAGEYFHPRRIVLYTNVIGNGKDAYEKVFIHELFHAYHYWRAENPGQSPELARRHDYVSKVVKESFASFFEQQYCNRYRLSCCGPKSSWGASVVCYPYSGARYIDSSAFPALFRSSLTNSENALREFIKDPDDLYGILNHTEEVCLPSIRLLLSCEFYRGGTPYSYLSDDLSIRVGDTVSVPVRHREVKTVRVVKVEIYDENNPPMDPSKLSTIFGRAENI